MSDDSEEYPSPFDRFPGGPIEAGVMDGRRLHGFDIPEDLARHYGIAEIQLLALTGEPPTEAEGRAFELCLTFLADVSILDASVHAGRVARHVHSILGNTPGTTATLGVGLAEQARFQLEQYEPWLAWLDAEDRGEPPELTTGDDDLVQQFTHLLPDEYGEWLESLGASMNLFGAILSVLHRLGVGKVHQLTTVLVMARLPIALAEAFSVGDPRLWSYPLNLPRWKYVGEEE